MSLLAAHLEQISLSCQGIDSLPFPPPKIFSNALLSNHDITSLIRDTEAHERALFSVPPPPPRPSKPAAAAEAEPKTGKSRRQTVFNVASGEVTAGPPATRPGAGPPRRNAAVAAVLGGDLHEQIRRGEMSTGGAGGGGGGGGGDLDIEVLLRGAEKLCGVYALPGALERIPALRSRYAHHRNTLAYYDTKVTEQAQALEQLNRDHWMGDDDDEEDGRDDGNGRHDGGGAEILTEEDLRAEEEELRELDRKKRELQERLRTMEKDLGGLLNM